MIINTINEIYFKPKNVNKKIIIEKIDNNSYIDNVKNTLIIQG